MGQLFYFIIIIQLSVVSNINSQNLIYAPEFKFSGTPVKWHHRPKEVNIDKQIGSILKLEQLFQKKKPILIDDKVFFLLDNGAISGSTGSTLICYDHLTGDSLWQNNYNPNYYGKGFKFFWDFRKIEDKLELFGYATIDTTLSFGRRWYNGFTSRVQVDPNGANLIVQINHDVSEGVVFQTSDPPIYLEGHDFAQFYQTGFPKDTQIATHSILTYVWDTNLKVREIPENNIVLKESEQSPRFWMNGPVLINPVTFVYLISIYLTKQDKFKHYIFQTEPYGKNKGLTEITEKIGDKNGILGYEESNGTIRLKLNSPYMDKYPGNAGYIYINENGKVIKDQRNWKIDDKPVGHVVSLDLKDSSEILHVIRFIDENNIYFYKEKNDGQIYKCGELIHENFKQFVFLPKFLLQTNDRDIILTFEGVLDSIEYGENFVLGGWPYICKIKGSDLSIVSNSGTISTTNFSISPNPVEDMVKIVVPQSNQDSELVVMNSMGKTVFEAKLCEFENEFSLAYLPSGLYSILIKEGNQVLMSKKMLKL